VEVLEPLDVREQIAETARAILARYSGRPRRAADSLPASG